MRPENPELRFFYCGNGDTILAYADGECGLIDCNLSRVSRVKSRLLRVLDEYDVQRLRFVCVSHYDADHLRGMASLLRERFSKDLCDGSGRRAWSIEQIIQPLPVKDVKRSMALLHEVAKRVHKERVDLDWSAETMEFLELTLQILTDSGAINEGEGVYLPTYSVPSFFRSPPFASKKLASFGPFEICFLAPEQSVSDGFEASKFNPVYESLLDQPSALKDKVSANAVSRVVVFRHLKTGHVVLFGGDSPEWCWPNVIQRWTEISRYGILPEEQSRWREFHVVKVSHHGAEDGHYPALFSAWCVPDETIAVISARSNDPKHPHESVSASLRANKVREEVTGQRLDQVAPRSGPVAGGRRVTPTLKASDIRIEFTSKGPVVHRIAV